MVGGLGRWGGGWGGVGVAGGAGGGGVGVAGGAGGGGVGGGGGRGVDLGIVNGGLYW